MRSIAFVGGGNMASALIGGLRREGLAGDDIVVIDPNEAQRRRVAEDFGVAAVATADAALEDATLVVWAVKPQAFAEASRPCAGRVARALQLSVMAGVRSDAIAHATGSERVVRAMPNTPALIGQGIAALFARPAVGGAERARAEALLAPTGQTLWVDDEPLLDAVTALSGSGPAYAFYLLEAMTDAGARLGLPAAAAHRLAVQTLAGSAALAAGSSDAPAVLRERVTSKGGTTAAAVSVLDERGVRAAFVEAIEAAARRARELGDELE